MRELTTGYECMTCESTGWVYVGYKKTDVVRCKDCENGYKDDGQESLLVSSTVVPNRYMEERQNEKSSK